MSDDPVFDKAMTFLLSHEGGFVDDAADPGGATKYGITLHELQSLGHLDDLHLDIHHPGSATVADIKALTLPQAAEIYRVEWWDHFGFARIKDAHVAAKLFDMAVNMGPGEAFRLACRAVRAAWFTMPEAGELSQTLISSLNAAPAPALLAAMNSEAAGFYRWLAATRPASAKFLSGWLNRAYSKV